MREQVNGVIAKWLLGLLAVILIGWWSWMSAWAISNRERIQILEANQKVSQAFMADVKSEIIDIKKILNEMRYDQMEFYKHEAGRWERHK